MWLIRRSHLFYCRRGGLDLTAAFDQFRSAVENNKSFLITTHVNPDGDGIGSELALTSYLRTKGKKVWIVNHSSTPPNYAFLDSKQEIIQFDSRKHESIVKEAAVVIVLDANHPDRLASMKEHVVRSKAFKVCIDHHLDPAEFADLYIIDEPSTATGEILYRLLVHLDRDSISKEVATSLYAAIMTDTGSFRYPKTDSEVHRMIAHLIDQGADPVEIYERVYERGPVSRLKLLAKVLASLQSAHEGKVAYLTVTRQMMNETGTSEVDTDAFVPYALGIENVQIGMMFTELADGIKINFRSKGDISINELAKEFGGNGHKNAAGARMANAQLTDELPNVVERSRAYTR
ncbi:MAG: Bifunctional oligoribonuclease/PAP phosphatase NrnA [Bacteroidetes bacterium]|nr:Bifunctional oligoribonuclease/PAP phosphatase NrnA [Bacteroidota bacterium]